MPVFCQADNPQPPVRGQVQLYVNGELQSAAECHSAWNATGHTELGRGLFGGNPTDFVSGLLGDVRLYDRALTPAQIKALYSQGPQAHWRLDQTAGGAAADSGQWQLQGGARWLSDKNSPLSLNGTTAFADAGRAVLDTGRSYTVSAWVSLHGLDGYQTLVSQDGHTLSGFYLQKRGDDGKFALAVREADEPNAPLALAESSFAPQANVLYHVVGVFNPPSAPVLPVPAATTPAPPASAALPWDGDLQGKFLESLAQDRQGRTWVATEDQGVWCFDPAGVVGKQWTQFTSKDGLGSDDVYGLLVDARGRLWAGTLHGVSVYDGRTWKTYGPLEGLGGSRVFALASCPTDGDVWVATEGGLTRYRAKEDRWQQYSRQDGLPSDAVQALAFNKKGDLFVGTQADGIALASAQNGYKTWRTVRGPVQLPDAAGGAGLPTSLINCLYVAHDGTVYAGTTAGLARSSDNGRTWRFLRGADWLEKRDGKHPQQWLDAGLVDQADVRAIEVLPLSGPAVRIAAGGSGEGDWKADQDFTGGQTFHTNDSINSGAVLNPAPQSVYQSARFGSFTYTVPHLKPGAPCRVRLHLAEVAYDKPGQRVFNVAVNGRRVLTHEDIFAEAGTKDKVIVKEFTASADAEGRLTLSFRGSQPLPSSAGHRPYELAEDYVTALAEDGAGHLLVGHRQTGVETLDTGTGKHVPARAEASPSTDFVTALLPRPDGTLLIGGYGSGLSQMPIIGTTSDGIFAQTADVTATSPTLPAPATAPTLTELNAMLRVVSTVPLDRSELQPHVVALQDDWLTEGDWLGRYGRYSACLCATVSPHNYYWGAGWKGIHYTFRMRPNVAPGDGLRYFVTWLYTQDPRVLEMPPTYLDSRVKKRLTTPNKNRREAEIDDHGEVYPQEMDGPHIYTTLTVPNGLFYLSLYDLNKDAHGEGGNRFRDYHISVRTQSGNPSDDLGTFDAQPELAHGRIRDFWGGVWKRFLVRGPVTLTVKIDRNNSRNTILPGVMLDLVDEMPPPYFGTVSQWEAVQAHQQEQRHQALLQGYITIFHPAATEQEAADRLLDTLDEARVTNSSWWGANNRLFYSSLLRWYEQVAAPSLKGKQMSLNKHLATCCYQLNQYQTWEEVQRSVGLTPARDVEKALRWDGKSRGGQGYQVVTQYLATQRNNESNTAQ